MQSNLKMNIHMSHSRSSLAVEFENMNHALRVSEVAKMLATSKMTIYRLVEHGTIPHFRIGCSIRFDPKAIADWLRTKMPPSRPAA
jgi:excisionase family DNA binding protein